MLKFLSIVGARPQFVKAAMIELAIECHNKRGAESRVEHVLLHTGQHYDPAMSDSFFEQLPLPTPKYQLGVGSGSHGAQTAAMLEGIERVLLQDTPDLVILYGDTNSTVAGALAAAKLHIRVAHLEAGMRSFNRQMPEELNRVATDHLSDIQLCPTETAVRNLEHEGISTGVYCCGDVMLDAALQFCPPADSRGEVFTSLGIQPHDYVLATIHRAENTDSPQRLEALLETILDLPHPVVLPMHPRVQHKLNDNSFARLKKRLDSSTRLKICPPASYLDMLVLEKNARVVVTDSGGVQKESYFLGVPCVTLREQTEWVETLAGGWNHLVGDQRELVLQCVHSLWHRNGAMPKAQPDLSAFGSGHAAEECVRVLVKETASGTN